ncbi:MAG: hypothetical protein FJZ04_01005 [Candidatus Moranbacteria bacterium]|nr:hypothetical protein [Candidatus Moranbacteria bacterium]
MENKNKRKIIILILLVEAIAAYSLVFILLIYLNSFQQKLSSNSIFSSLAGGGGIPDFTTFKIRFNKPNEFFGQRSPGSMTKTTYRTVETIGKPRMEAYWDQIAHTYHPNNLAGRGMPEWMPKEFQQKIIQTPFNPKGIPLDPQNAKLVENTIQRYGTQIPDHPRTITIQERELIIPVPRSPARLPQESFGFKTAPTDPEEYNNFSNYLIERGVSPESIPPPGATYIDKGTLKEYTRAVFGQVAVSALPLLGIIDTVKIAATLPLTPESELGLMSNIKPLLPSEELAPPIPQPTPTPQPDFWQNVGGPTDNPFSVQKPQRQYQTFGEIPPPQLINNGDSGFDRGEVLPAGMDPDELLNPFDKYGNPISPKQNPDGTSPQETGTGTECKPDKDSKCEETETPKGR